MTRGRLCPCLEELFDDLDAFLRHLVQVLVLGMLAHGKDLELVRLALRQLDDVFRRVCQLDDVDTEAPVRDAWHPGAGMQVWQRAGRVRTGLDLVKERDILFLRSFFLSDVCEDMQILHVANLLVEYEPVKVRCKETQRPDVRSDVF